MHLLANPKVIDLNMTVVFKELNENLEEYVHTENHSFLLNLDAGIAKS